MVLLIGGGRRFGMGVTTAGVWVTGVPSGPGAESRPVEGLGDEVPQKLKNFKNSYKKILRIFGSISHIFIYINYFSCLQASFH